MSVQWQLLDDVALREVFKSLDPSTLQRCRRVCLAWNNEIQRLNKSTRKFHPKSIMMELDGTGFRLYLGSPKSPKPFEDPSVSSATVHRVLTHVSPPETLSVLFKEHVDDEIITEVTDGISSQWCSGVQQLEIVTYSGSNLPKILSTLAKFNAISTISLSHFCNENISCAEVFKQLPELRYLRIFAFNGNSSTGISSGLVFDEAAVEELLRNQNGFRRIQSVEFYNTDVRISMDSMMDTLIRLARLPVHPEVLQKPLFPENHEEATSVHLLFENCLWESIKEHELLTEIMRISSETVFPTRQSPEEPLLKGAFRFRIHDTQFVLKFMTR